MTRITLATLPKATAQEVFDQVSEHMLSQKVRSQNSNGCAYRGDDGLMCAAGCLIADSEYTPHMDNEDDGSWAGLVDEGVFPKEHLNLIGNLQHIHDAVDPDGWKEELESLAGAFNLKFNH